MIILFKYLKYIINSLFIYSFKNRALRQHQTVLIVTHRPQALEICDKEISFAKNDIEWRNYESSIL